jgi:hypothetical protein
MASFTLPLGTSTSPERPLLADADAVERTDDRVRQLVLVPGRPGEVLHRQLLEPVGGERRRHLALLALVRRPRVRRLEDHRRAQVGDLLEPTGPSSLDRRIAGRRDDAFVGGQEVVRIRVEVGDPPDHGGSGDEVVAVGEQLREEVGVAGIGHDQAVVGMVVVRLRDRTVLRVIVDADDAVTARQQLLDDIAADEPRGSTDQDCRHAGMLL